MKKNNLVLMIVTISIFVVLLIGATYAYFASNANVGNGLDFSVTTDENNIAFTATSGTLSLHVAAENMLQSQIGQGDVIAAQQTGENNINVTLSSNTATPIACTYNIYFKWNTNEAYLTPTNASKNEFTLELELQDSDGTGSEGTNKFASETQLTKVITNTNKTLVVEGASIVGSSLDSGSQTWVPTARFYNLTDDQSALAGATFGGKFTIEDVECNVKAGQTLSETILAQAGDTVYTSSQDGSSYMIKDTLSELKLEYDYYMGGDVSLHDNRLSQDFILEHMLSASEYLNASSGPDDQSQYKPILNGNIWSFDWNDGVVSTVEFDAPKNGIYHVCVPYGNLYNVSGYVSIKVGTNTTSASFSLGGGGVPMSQDYICAPMGTINANERIRVEVAYIGEGYGQTYNDIQMIFISDSEGLYSGPFDFRYIGANPNNYVRFNGNEEWRIVGIMTGDKIGLDSDKVYTKIVRSESIGNYTLTYDGECEGEGECPYYYWSDSSLNAYLNGDYFTNFVGKDKIARGEPTGELYAEYGKWAAGSTAGELGEWTPDYGYYLDEQGSSVKTPIGMISYYSDYIPSVYEGNSWLKSSEAYWTMAMYDYQPAYIIGNAVYSQSIEGVQLGVRPAVYLEHNVTISQGTGTKADPYVLH